MAPADIGLGGLIGGGLRLALLQFDLVEPRAQHVPGLRLVLVLRTAGLTDHRDPGRNVRQAHRGFGLVDVLAAGAARAHGVGANVGFVDVDLDRVVDHRKDRDRRERGVPPRVGIERRDPHQPMHAGFGLQPAIGVVAADLDGRGLDAGLFALGLLEIFDLEAVLLGPARIHAQQHRGPVLALGAAGAGMDFEIGVEAVGLAAEQRFELAAGDFLLQGFQRGLGLGHDALIVLGLAEFDHADIVLELALDLADAGKRILQRGSLLHQLLRLLRIVPEIGVFGELVQLGEACRRCIDVKDASSAARLTA